MEEKDAKMLQKALEAVSWLQSNTNILGNMQSFQAGSSSKEVTVGQAVAPQESEDRSSRKCSTPITLSRDVSLDGSLDTELSSISSGHGELSNFNVIHYGIEISAFGGLSVAMTHAPCHASRCGCAGCCSQKHWCIM